MLFGRAGKLIPNTLEIRLPSGFRHSLFFIFYGITHDKKGAQTMAQSLTRQYGISGMLMEFLAGQNVPSNLNIRPFRLSGTFCPANENDSETELVDSVFGTKSSVSRRAKAKKLGVY